MKNLLDWFLTDKKPANYDCESGTAIEQTARVYRAMQELITEYNKWVENSNKIISDFTASETKNREVFEIALRQEFQDFINVVDLKTLELEHYIKTNLNASVRKLWDEMVETGEIQEAFMTTLELIVTKANEQAQSNEQFKADINADVEQFKNDINTDVEQFKNDINTDVEQFKNDINTDVEQFKNDINTDVEQFKTNVNGNLEAFQDWVNEESEPGKLILNKGKTIYYGNTMTNGTLATPIDISEIKDYTMVMVNCNSILTICYVYKDDTQIRISGVGNHVFSGDGVIQMGYVNIKGTVNESNQFFVTKNDSEIVKIDGETITHSNAIILGIYGII